MERLRLGELLVSAQLLTQEQLDDLLGSQQDANEHLGTLVVERGLLTESQLVQVLSQQLAVPWISLYHIEFTPELLQLIPADVAREHQLIPVKVGYVRGQGDTLHVAMLDPSNRGAISLCIESSRMPVRAMIAAPGEIRSAIATFYGQPLSDTEVPAARASDSSPPPSRAQLPTQPDVLAKAPVTFHEPSAHITDTTGPTPDLFELVQEPEVVLPLSVGTMLKSDEEILKPSAIISPNIPDFDDEGIPVEYGISFVDDEEEDDDSPPATEPSSAHPSRTPSKRGLSSFTFLDGTTISLNPTNAKKTGSPTASSGDELRAGDILAALRAAAHGVDASEMLGRGAKWEAMVSAILTVLLSKGIITEAELVAELRRF